MKTSEFDYDLAPEHIAQTPVGPRDASRLMVVNRADGSIVHRYFRDIGDYLSADDLLVFNDSRVIPARLFAHKLWPPRPGETEPRKGGCVELLLLNRRENGHWHALVKGKRVREGTRLALLESETGCWAGIEATVTGLGERGERLIAFDPPLEIGDALDRIGTVPLPPYIRTALDDPERYQTVYARWPGSVAAPTAGLHFTPELLSALRRRGIQFGFVTLHIGLDTFRPVSTEQIEDHPMHTEFVLLNPQTAEQVNQARLAGRRVVAVGTTVVRVLESAAQRTLVRARLSSTRLNSSQAAEASAEASIEPAACMGQGACAWQTVTAFEGPTDMFITPGYRFGVVDRLVTNFHLPRSTLLMLVSAFAGLDLIRRAYQAAIETGYRFYSFGDAMLIL
jgi:S-adenosylmethionine:tRNA ribosyltransferase-isomerase